MLIAVQNAQADLRAGFTAARDMSSHGNGYGDVEIRDAINQGRIDGPRYQVSTLRHRLGRHAGRPAARTNPLASTVVRSVEEARAAVREQIEHGADWIKLFPTGAYSFTPTGEAQYVLTYPMPVLQALIDETHRLGKKAGCHVFGGEGPEERHRRRLRHHRARLRPDSGAGRHDGREEACSTIRRSRATSSRTWTTTTPRTPAASTG